MTFGNYELLTRLRVGGMAEVWKARTLAEDRTVAVKRILPSFTDEADYVAMFVDEARLSLRLAHPGIVRAFELGQVDDEHFIALEYIDGFDVGSLIRIARERSAPLDVESVCRIGIEVCAALHYAHELRDERGAPLGVVHRDVSPQNILISRDGAVKLIDFGIAKSTEQLMRTQAGLLKGKYGYLSPEQAQGVEVDRRSDLFTLGICLWELLAARRLFQGSSDFSTIGRVRKGEIAALETLNEDVPAEFAAIVHRALARDRNVRFQSAAEMQAALEALAAQRSFDLSEAALARVLSERFADAKQVPSEPAAAARDESTGLLDAFNGVEPLSTVSALIDNAPQEPEPLLEPSAAAPVAAPAPDMQPAIDAGPGLDESEFVTLLESDHEPAPALRNGPVSEPLRQPSDAAELAGEEAGDEEAITDRPPAQSAPTRVVSYESMREGEVAVRSDDPTRVDRKQVPHGAAAPAELEAAADQDASEGLETPRPPAMSSTAPALRGGAQMPMAATLGMEWEEEELSTQIYDSPTQSEESSRDSDQAPVRAGSLPVPSTSGRPLPFATTQTASSATPPRGSIPAAAAASQRNSKPTPRGWAPRSPERVSLPPQSSAPPVFSTVPPRARVSMPPMGSNRASVAPMSSQAAPMLAGPSRSAMAVAAGVAAIVVAAVVAGVAWFARPAPAMLHITTDPIDAVVTVDGVRVSGNSSPYLDSDLASEVDHEIEVSKPGYRTWRTRLRLGAGRVIALPRVQLVPETGNHSITPAGRAQPPAAAPAPAPQPPPAAPPVEAAPAKPQTTSSSAASEPAPHRTPQRPRAAAQRPAPPAPAAQSEGESATLRINSRPWSRVYIDGRLIGNTPQMQVKLSAGWHTVTLVNPDFGLQKVLTVRAKPGEVITKSIDLGR